MYKGDFVIQEVEFRWNKFFSPDFVPIQKGKTWWYYNCYSFEINESNQNSFYIRFSPSLKVISGEKVLFDGCLFIDCHLYFESLEVLTKDILIMGAEAHQRFKRLLHEKELLTFLDSIPIVYDERVMKNLLGIGLLTTV